jgi:hypothetical protein
MHVTPVGENIFVDLGFKPSEAKSVKEKPDRRMDGRVKKTSALVTYISSAN